MIVISNNHIPNASCSGVLWLEDIEDPKFCDENKLSSYEFLGIPDFKLMSGTAEFDDL